MYLWWNVFKKAYPEIKREKLLPFKGSGTIFLFLHYPVYYINQDFSKVPARYVGCFTCIHIMEEEDQLHFKLLIQIPEGLPDIQRPAAGGDSLKSSEWSLAGWANIWSRNQTISFKKKTGKAHKQKCKINSLTVSAGF